MLKIKHILSVFLILILSSSCSEYQKVLNKGKIEEQYTMATKMYEAQKFGKAIQLFEKITPGYRGKPQMERIQFMVAQSHYNTKQYSLAAYYFDKFVKNYPKSSKLEEAAYLSAYSYFLASPRYSLDQKDSMKALNSMQKYILKYPNSTNIEEANNTIKLIRHRLEKKSFEVAKLYYNTGSYKASLVAFDNLLSDYLGTSYKEEALYYKLKASHDLAIKSVASKKEERLNNAIKAYQKLKRSFPNSEFLKDSDKLLETLNKELSLITDNKVTEIN